MVQELELLSASGCGNNVIKSRIVDIVVIIDVFY